MRQRNSSPPNSPTVRPWAIWAKNDMFTPGFLGSSRLANLATLASIVFELSYRMTHMQKYRQINGSYRKTHRGPFSECVGMQWITRQNK